MPIKHHFANLLKFCYLPPGHYLEGAFMKKNRLFTYDTRSLKMIFTIGLVSLLASCAKQPKSKDEMSFDELKEKTFVMLEKKDRETAIECLERIIAHHADRPDIAKYKMLLAETYFKDEQYAAAYEMFEHCNQFYPSDLLAEYSKYKSVLSKFYQTLRTDCDQTPTEETIKLCKEYLDTPDYKEYRKDVDDIKKTCLQKLIDKEVYVFDFYLHQNQYDSARKRIDYLKSTYLPKHPSIEPRLLYLECKLAKRQKKDDVILQNLTTLASKYPESQFTSMGQALVAKNTFRM